MTTEPNKFPQHIGDKGLFACFIAACEALEFLVKRLDELATDEDNVHAQVFAADPPTITLNYEGDTFEVTVEDTWAEVHRVK